MGQRSPWKHHTLGTGAGPRPSIREVLFIQHVDEPTGETFSFPLIESTPFPTSRSGAKLRV